MPKEALLPQDTTLNGQEYVRMVDSDGRSVLVPIASFDNYVQRASYFAVYDGATDVAIYSESQSNVASVTGVDSMNLRLGFSGPLSDGDYWPSIYGDLVENSQSDPASSNFDFRLLTDIGTKIYFDVEYSAQLHDDSGYRIAREFPLVLTFTYPNGTTEKQTITIPNDYVVTTTAENFFHKQTFSTYIKNVLLDSLQGGTMVWTSVNALGPSEIVTIKDLKITVRI